MRMPVLLHLLHLPCQRIGKYCVIYKWLLVQTGFEKTIIPITKTERRSPFMKKIIAVLVSALFACAAFAAPPHGKPGPHKRPVPHAKKGPDRRAGPHARPGHDRRAGPHARPRSDRRAGPHARPGPDRRAGSHARPGPDRRHAPDRRSGPDRRPGSHRFGR